MEITINNNGDLINTTTQEKPVIQDTFTITNHNIDDPVSYTHLTLPTTARRCRSRWSPYH